MNERLAHETRALERSWAQHSSAHLSDYLVAGVEDPRINLQSVFSRHAILWRLGSARFADLMEQEYRFAAAMNWLLQFTRENPEPETGAAVLDGLKRQSDNAEGIELPRFLVQLFGLLPAETDRLQIPNYIQDFLEAKEGVMDTFARLWQRALYALQPFQQPRLAVLEPACGSANDYRFLASYGLAAHITYSGFDLCPANIENARTMFPGVRFDVGNVFEIDAADRSYDLCFFHDLLEHLSLEGLQVAAREICRVTRTSICAGFFNMDETPEHLECPVEEYFWNTLSRWRMEETFASFGFKAEVFHVGTFLQEKVGCSQTHNPNAYTMRLVRKP